MAVDAGALRDRSGAIPILACSMKTQEKLAAKIYDLVRPALTPNGILDDDLQKQVLAPLLERIKRRDVNHSKYFDFSVTRTINNELRTEGWKP